jgi:hypothetical protein
MNLLALLAVAVLLSGCATLTPQEGAIADGAITLGQIAGTAAASVYGGPAAGQLASAGLSALAAVLQGYVGSKIPPEIVAASPGVPAVAEAITPLVAANKTVTQADVNTVWTAAAVASAQ